MSVNVELSCEQVFNAFLQCLKPKYKVYTALLNQQNTDNVSATVLENTLGGDVVWERESSGNYKAYLSTPFDLTKTIIFIGTVTGQNGNVFLTEVNSGNVLLISFDSNQQESDNMLYNTPIEIRVYN